MASSGNGHPIPPRMRVTTIPRYGKWFIRLSWNAKNSDLNQSGAV
jgi:hypothetical protein